MTGYVGQSESEGKLGQATAPRMHTHTHTHTPRFPLHRHSEESGARGTVVRGVAGCGVRVVAYARCGVT